MAPAGSSGFVDPGWEHGVAQDEKKKKVKCNYCGKIVSGGIYRLKQHLARISGEVTYCDKTPDEVCLRMKEILEGCRSSKKMRQCEEHNGQAYINLHNPNDDEDDEEEHGWFRSKGKHAIGEENARLSLTPLRSSGYVDPGWDHGISQDVRKKKVKCNYCGKIVSGGINRFKQHLARIPGEVAPCKNAPEEVYLKIKENMKWHRAGRKQNKPDALEALPLDVDGRNANQEVEEDEDGFHGMNSERLMIYDRRYDKDIRKNFNGVSSRNVSEQVAKRPRPNSLLKAPNIQALSPSKQRKTHAGSSRVSRKEVTSAICKFFYHAGIPAQAADSLYFHKMLEVIGQYGQALAAPTSLDISDRFLQDEVSTVRGYLAEYKSSWATTGCSIMVDSWTDTDGRTLINFLVSCPRGVYFNSSVDATHIVGDAFSLFKLLDKLVEEIGEENVVQVITHNTPSYKAAGKMLEEKRNNLYWTPCATYCIEQILEDFTKLELVAECMQKGQRITRLIYNQSWLLNFMKTEFTQGEELLRPALTRYSSSFATLHNLLDHRTGLRRLFQSNKWTSSRCSKSNEGKEVEKMIGNASFWKKVHYVRKSVDPVIQVLQMIDSGETLSLPYIYSYVYRAKLAIKSIHGDDARKYGPFWRVIDYHWNSLFHHPLHVAAYFFNPSYRYRHDFLAHSEVVRGVNECIVRLEPDNMKRITALKQILDYTSAKADFGTDLAINTRTELEPAAWWHQHGISCLELQRVAVRILSHTCSSVGFEHNWSIYDQMNRQRQSRFVQKNLEDLIYVHYNLRLREKQLRRQPSDSVHLDIAMLEHLLADWIVTPEKQSTQEDEEMLYGENGGGNEDADYDNRYSDDEEDGTSEMRSSQPFDLDQANAGTTGDEDANLDFYDDDPSDG